MIAPNLPLPVDKWLALVAKSRGNPRRTRGIKVVDGTAYATDNTILLTAPAVGVIDTTTQDWGVRDISASVRKRQFRGGKWRRVSKQSAAAALAAEGQLFGNFRAVSIRNDLGSATHVQIPLLKVALKGLNLDRLRLACKSDVLPVHMTDGERHVWVMPVKATPVPPGIPEVLA